VKTAFKLIVTHEAKLHYGRLSLKGFLPLSLWGNIKEVKAQGVLKSYLNGDTQNANADTFTVNDLVDSSVSPSYICIINITYSSSGK